MKASALAFMAGAGIPGWLLYMQAFPLPVLLETELNAIRGSITKPSEDTFDRRFQEA